MPDLTMSLNTLLHHAKTMSFNTLLHHAKTSYQAACDTYSHTFVLGARISHQAAEPLADFDTKSKTMLQL